MYQINDLNEFVVYIRKISLEKFSESNYLVDDCFSSCLSEEKKLNEVDNIISLQEVENIVLNIVKKNKNGEYRFREKKLFKIIEEINTRIISNILNNLVKKDIIDVGFDEEQNDFVFWIKDSN